MNTVGIDYQQTATVIALREGEGQDARLRSLGDGLRRLIPNAILGQRAWGSSALLAEDRGGLRRGDDRQDGPWLDPAAAPVFWSSLYRRVQAYLGGLAPVPANGFHLVVGLQAQAHPAAAAAVARLAAQAGFDDPACIPATDALLCRWLAERAADYSVVVAVIQGDTSTAVRAYRLRPRAGGRAIVEAASAISTVPGAGQAAWVRRISDLLAGRLGGAIPAEEELAVRDAAIEFGARLSHGDDHEPITWSGPLSERMVKPVQITRAASLALPEAQQLDVALGAGLAKALAGVNVTQAPDLILRGGPGAAWPFGLQALAAVASSKRIWQSADPAQDVAWGAAWWPELGQPSEQALRWQGAPSLAAPPAPPPPADLSTPSEAESAPVPPWKRKTWMDV
jgi:hypothetical protein